MFADGMRCTAAVLGRVASPIDGISPSRRIAAPPGSIRSRLPLKPRTKEGLAGQLARVLFAAPRDLLADAGGGAAPAEAEEAGP